MPSICRVGDIGVGFCSCHNSTIPIITTLIDTTTTTFDNDLNVATIGSVGVASCGHLTFAVTGSPDVFYEEQPVHRIGDTGVTCSGTYTMVTGSVTTFSNG